MLDKAKNLAPELTRLRHDIHKHPELSFQEFRTAALVADTLREIGIEPRTQVGRTGVVAEIGNDNGPTIAIRADMDALPILEKTGAAYASVNEGVHHACGHDAHTAMLLGVAHLLKESFATEKWQGKVRLLFQPSEEAYDDQGISGATAMIEDGAMAGVDAAIALHVASHEKAGLVQLQDGYSLAAVDSFYATIRGDGGHGAYPHSGSDPVHILSLVLPAIYSIQSRQIDPLRPSVISIGAINGGTTTNVIPREIQIQGTIRSHHQNVREQLWAELERALSLSVNMGGSYEFKLVKGYPALYNDPKVNGWMRQTAKDLLDDNNVIDFEFGMGAEDFAYMAQAAPGAMFSLGAAIPDGIARHHHTDIFDIDDSVLPIGAAILAETARRFVLGEIE
jgi:amidohydrolase